MSSLPFPTTQTALGNILLIDNDEDLLKAMTIRLEHMGYRCITARTGAQGLSEFDPRHIDLIVTDLNMPVLDGIDLVKKVRETSNVLIIIVTGFRKEYTKVVRELENVILLEKPFDVSTFLELIETEMFFTHNKRAA